MSCDVCPDHSVNCMVRNHGGENDSSRGRSCCVGVPSAPLPEAEQVFSSHRTEYMTETIQKTLP